MKLVAVVLACASIAVLSSSAHAQPVPESVYPPPEPSFTDDPREAQTGFHFDLEARYLTDYVWRGIERFDEGRAEDERNFQLDTRISFDLGKLPHPYVNLFVNVAEDPISSFQEVRPEVGFDWTIRPITISAGYTSYIFPDREGIDTAEVFLRLALDDSAIFRTERGILNPYVFAAYDFDVFEGLYAEAGVNHQFPIENTGLVFNLNAHVAYVNGYELFSADGIEDSGLQHWQVGLTAKYTLNQLLNIPDRFGRLSVLGYLNYTDGIDSELTATEQLWGGAGFSIEF